MIDTSNAIKVASLSLAAVAGLIVGVIGGSELGKGDGDTPYTPSSSGVISRDYCEMAAAISRTGLLRSDVGIVARYRVNNGLSYVDWTDYPPAPSYNPVAQNEVGEDVEVDASFAACVRERGN